MNKRIGSVIGWLLLIAAAVMLFSALYPDSAERKQEQTGKTIQLILRTNEGEYWQNMAKGAQAAVKEFGITLHISAASDQGDVDGQLQKAMQSLEAQPDAIVLGANDDAAFEPFLKAAADRHIPVIAIDSILTSGKTASYIGMDNYLAGREAVREMAEQLGGEGNVTIIAYTMGGINGKLREQGIRDAIAEYPGLRLVDRQQCSDEFGDCQQTVSGILDTQKVNGILSLNTEASIGAALELKRRKFGEQVKLVGFDSSPELLELLQENQLQTLIVQNPFSMGYLGIKYALEAAGGKTVPSRVEMNMKLIDQENMFWMENQKLLFPVVQ